MEGKLLSMKGMVRDCEVELTDLCKYYQVGGQEVRALDAVTLSIQKNEFVAIMGPSGSGKSTLMNLLGCLDTPTSGRYVLHGTDVSQMTAVELARVRNREIGFVFQSFHLLSAYTAWENVALPLYYAGVPRKERKKRAEQALLRVGLQDRMEHKPQEMSGGQRQRVALARALITEPSVILADEPTGNLDSATSQEVMNLFQQIHEQGNTLLLVTHDPEVAAYAHRILCLKDGRIERDEQLINTNYGNLYENRGSGNHGIGEWYSDFKSRSQGLCLRRYG